MKKCRIPLANILMFTFLLLLPSTESMANECFPESFSFTTPKEGYNITVAVVKRDNLSLFSSTASDSEFPCPSPFETCKVMAYDVSGDAEKITALTPKFPICCGGETEPYSIGGVGDTPVPNDCNDPKKTSFPYSCASNSYKITYDTSAGDKKRYKIYFEDKEFSTGLIDMAVHINTNVYYGTIIGPECPEICPKPDYSTDTIQTFKWLSTGDPDVNVQVEYNYNLGTGCIESIRYMVNNSGTWINAAYVNPSIEVGDGSELMIECGDSDGNQYCRTCQFTTSRNPTCTYIRSGGKTMRVCW